MNGADSTNHAVVAVRKQRASLAAAGAIVALSAVVCFILCTSAPPTNGDRPIVRGTLINSAPGARESATSGDTSQLLSDGNKVPRAATKAEGEYIEAGFDKLAGFPGGWICQTVNPITLAWVPKLAHPLRKDIAELDGKKVAVRGFMLPLKGDREHVTEFLLMKNQMTCCYGKPPNLNDWVQVRMIGNGVKILMDQPVTVCGTLHIGQYHQEQLYAGMYRLDGEKVEEAAGF